MIGFLPETPFHERTQSPRVIWKSTKRIVNVPGWFCSCMSPNQPFHVAGEVCTFYQLLLIRRCNPIIEWPECILEWAALKLVFR